MRPYYAKTKTGWRLIRGGGDMKCQVEDCKATAKWKLYRYNRNGTKDWISVCDKHEEVIGDENYRRATKEEI